MSETVTQVVWTRQARESLNAILDYRYKETPSAISIVKKDVIRASKALVFAKQYQGRRNISRVSKNYSTRL
ncbi:hypothetical protein NBRC110019_14800 [Neptunitalea chrysea]|uniref:Uncharacterized protein n=1 Tax=Neptunitalea chrysea TaxID=1647581 RepID=A0A9W6B6E2_9FLAO|nr:hypothetical protein [Neptunitalea chrysea]GLB52440.1 hypothetical protein NBRC110019_14800 [Neptunitalea chrysea]